MKKNIFFNNINEKILIIILIPFSFIINQYYGNLGVFPVDSFSHFDTGYKVLLGDHPFKDYWVVSGPLLDYLQAVFFYLFGVNWQSYLLHASLFNAVLTLSTFLILKDFKLNIYYCFFYSILFSILAYPSSGTPFVDHHSAFFCLLSIYSLMLAIKYEKKIYWYILPLLLACAFFSKQVPSAYVILSLIIVLIFYSVIQKNYIWSKHFVFSSFLILFSLLVFGKIQGISFSSFLEQYILYPQTIRLERLESFNLTINQFLSHFKFIHISLILLFYVNIKLILLKKNYIKQNGFCNFLILTFFTFSLISHQLLTKNQTFIFFIIPILIAFASINLNTLKFKFNSIIQILLILICLLITVKYHVRFNEGRKFHELSNINVNLFTRGQEIDNKFKGLKWITPEYKDSSAEEVALINEVKLHLSKDGRAKMLLTNYSFFSVLLEENLHAPSRWYLSDGTDYPLKGSKYFIKYKNLIINHIKKNEILVIYTIEPLDNSTISTYLGENCFKKNKISTILNSYELKSCQEIND